MQYYTPESKGALDFHIQGAFSHYKEVLKTMKRYSDSKIKEACGVFGIYSISGEPAAESIYYGLSSLQHRGQESCGIAVCDTRGPKGNMNSHKGMGLVNEVFNEETLGNLQGNLGIGHVRSPQQGPLRSITPSPSS